MSKKARMERRKAPPVTESDTDTDTDTDTDDEAAYNSSTLDRQVGLIYELLFLGNTHK